jgi:hypothetical protein
MFSGLGRENNSLHSSSRKAKEKEIPWQKPQLRPVSLLALLESHGYSQSNYYGFSVGSAD